MAIPSFVDPAADRDDTERFARMTPEERIALFLSVCDLTDAIQRERPNHAALRAGTPLSDEALATWSRLMRDARRRG